ncbi:MAG: phosphoglucomutase/phosphomannomutase family protein [Candidatus Gastranaerophilales bacterium]|nr:phosphoglucomutase/phosphomannomutase family protein [Candidatus Gastranaerophilales bacterium]
MPHNIKFGTDGFRAIIAEDFTFKNVELITKSIAIYIKNRYGADKPVLIGYDTRFMADKFAKFSAEILQSLGYKVLLSNAFLPTPAIAYCAKHLCSAGAIMFTASHNPPEYCGIKYIPDYAGPATNAITDEIVANIGIEPQPSGKKHEIQTFCAKDYYFAALEELIDFDKIKTLKTKIIFDPLYATAQGYFDTILNKNGIEVTTIHNWTDPLYGGHMPEPKEQYLGELKQLVLSNQNAVGFSNDGDADRYGVFDENGEYVTPNEVMTILLNHLIKYKKAKGKLIKTVAGSLMLDKTAEIYNIEVIETAVGFKHVGEAMRENPTIIGGEESGGLSIGVHIPEKDGILANLLVLEAMAYAQKPLFELKKEIKELIKTNYINKRYDLKLSEEQKQKMLDLFLNTPPTSFAGKAVTKTCKKDGVKFYMDDNNSWILIRFSGTEPLLRIYFESPDENFIEQAFNEIKRTC